jgi:hypothetical protein
MVARIRRYVLLVPLAGLLLVLIGASGLVAGLDIRPKAFTLPRVVVTAELDRDGTMRVVERITYDFRGAFTYGTRPIPGGPYLIEDVRVTEDGRELEQVGAPYNLRWFFTAEDERRTFTVGYTVRDAVTVGPDVAELYWKWVGEDHPGIGRVRVTLTVPGGPGAVRAWGHGDLAGEVAVAGDRVTWSAPDVPAGSFVEGRVAVPAARVAVAPFGAPRLDRILVQERAWAASANQARRAAEAAVAAADRRRDLATVMVPVLVVLGVVVFGMLFVRHGREPEPPDVGEYVRDLPDDPPAVVDTLLQWGRVRPIAFGATVVDLAQRGHLAITEERTDRPGWFDRTDYRFRRTDQAVDDGVLPHERQVLDRLFGTGPETTQSELTATARADPRAAQVWWRDFRGAVRREFVRRGYQVGDRSRIFAANIGCAVVIGAAGALAWSWRAWWVGALGVAWGLTQCGLTLLLRRRTPLGARRAAEWEGVERYLRDFSTLEDAPPGHLVLWERYLVYAVALGVSARLASAMAARVPALTEMTHTGRWYVPARGPRGLDGLAAFGVGLSNSFVTASTPRSGGSGTGGGFSGGGGGGGGGGGIGAG